MSLHVRDNLFAFGQGDQSLTVPRSEIDLLLEGESFSAVIMPCGAFLLDIFRAHGGGAEAPDVALIDGVDFLLPIVLIEGGVANRGCIAIPRGLDDVRSVRAFLVEIVVIIMPPIPGTVIRWSISYLLLDQIPRFKLLPDLSRRFSSKQLSNRPFDFAMPSVELGVSAFGLSVWDGWSGKGGTVLAAKYSISLGGEPSRASNLALGGSHML